ncbi:MAG: DUF393 domain-containing protein [Leptolyngbya sp. RL_3_1]|nr:DUF393 domain-containing protein [Leptolyngbya sp. RL_3_1]
MPNPVSPDATALPETVSTPAGIIFFDGECLLCNGFVDLLLRLDTAGIFAMAPLQGPTAQRLLPPRSDRAEDWSMYYLETAAGSTQAADIEETGTLYSQSDAAIAVMARLGGIWSVLSWIRLIPRALRNAIYRIIARNRYRWFGRRATCRRPSPQEQARFLP